MDPPRLAELTIYGITEDRCRGAGAIDNIEI